MINRREFLLASGLLWGEGALPCAPVPLLRGQRSQAVYDFGVELPRAVKIDQCRVAESNEALFGRAPRTGVLVFAGGFLAEDVRPLLELALTVNAAHETRRMGLVPPVPFGRDAPRCMLAIARGLVTDAWDVQALFGSSTNDRRSWLEGVLDSTRRTGARCLHIRKAARAELETVDAASREFADVHLVLHFEGPVPAAAMRFLEERAEASIARSGLVVLDDGRTFPEEASWGSGSAPWIASRRIRAESVGYLLSSTALAGLHRLSDALPEAVGAERIQRAWSRSNRRAEAVVSALWKNEEEPT